MLLKVFAVHDQKAKAYLSPFFFPETGQALRAFTDAVNGDRTHAFAKYPSDYTLFQIGTFETSSGELTGMAPELVVTGVQVKE